MLLTQDDISYLRQAAQRDKYNADDALKVFSYESSNRTDVWGGKGKQYFGLFQAGPSERAQFGIDTQNPTAKNQIDAFGRFLAARGFKPGMGLLDMYSTVNAGSPGHYNASDAPGMTVAKHVAAMGGMPALQQPISGSAPILQAGFQPSAPVGLADAGSEPVDVPQYDAGAMRGLLARLMPEEEPGLSPAPQISAAPMPTPRPRGLAFRQLTVKTSRFGKR